MQCYTCSGSLNSDCANNDPGTKGLSTIDDSLENPSCVVYTLKGIEVFKLMNYISENNWWIIVENNVTSAMIARTGIYKIGLSPCDWFRKLVEVDKCISCIENLCNINPMDWKYELKNGKS